MSSADIRGMFAGLPGAHGIIEAALNGQGRVMTDDSARPSSAAVLAGDFLFFGGEPSEELVRRALNAENRAWIVQGSSAFLALVQAQRSGTWSKRIAFDPHRQPEDAHLTALLANLPQGVTLVPIGAAEMAFCRKTPWAADFVSQFTEDEYARSGLGGAGLRARCVRVGCIQLRGVSRRHRGGGGHSTGAPRTRLRDAGSGEAHLDGASAGENRDVGRGE